ncbi:hypothetical protein ACNKHW_20400 [Shigella flexneri]
MTPQLQQAIRLLQLSTLELQREIPRGAGSNALLELMITIRKLTHLLNRKTQKEMDSAEALGRTAPYRMICRWMPVGEDIHRRYAVRYRQ